MVRYQCSVCNNIQESSGQCSHCSAVRSQLRMVAEYANHSASLNTALYGDMGTQCRTWGPSFYYAFAITILVVGIQENSVGAIIFAVFAIVLPPICLVIRRVVFLQQSILPGDLLPCFYFCCNRPPAAKAEATTTTAETANPVV